MGDFYSDLITCDCPECAGDDVEVDIASDIKADDATLSTQSDWSVPQRRQRARVRAA